MGISKLETSLESGMHKKLESLIGNWEGITKTWFEPGVIADESSMKGAIRPLLGGRFVMHEYKGSLNDKPFEGIAIYGFDIPNSTFQSSWVDSFHMGTGMMFSTGNETENGFSVLGSYGSPDIPEPWGWRTTVALIDEDNLEITAYNISPDGQEDMAMQTRYQKVIS